MGDGHINRISAIPVVGASSKRFVTPMPHTNYLQSLKTKLVLSIQKGDTKTTCMLLVPLTGRGKLRQSQTEQTNAK